MIECDNKLRKKQILDIIERLYNIVIADDKRNPTGPVAMYYAGKLAAYNDLIQVLRPKSEDVVSRINPYSQIPPDRGAHEAS